MSLLRIYSSLSDQAQSCHWALIDDGREAVSGQGRLADLPKRVDRVQLVIPATQVLITRARIPHGARRGPGSVLAFAVEEKMAGEPDASQVSWLGSVGDEDALAVIDRKGLERWREALGAAGIRVDEVHCETLLLPLVAGEWSIAWNGSEGFVRSGEFEGATTDCGDRNSPPLGLCLMLDEAKARGAGPASIALYVTTPDAEPDVAAWQRELGSDLRVAGSWDWRTAPADAGVCMAQQRQRWRVLSGAVHRLRPAAWILGAALALHAIALVTDWSLLASEQRALRQKMESQFRGAFPDTVAVVDPALQMRRKLAEARHAAGMPDGGDFLPMIEQVAAAAKELPAGTLRTVSYEGGQMTLELSTNAEAAIQALRARLLQSGLSIEVPPAATRAAKASVVLIVRAS
ncbi:MAG: type II secretion system protein GspL [Rhodocyclales bacterium]|nr:type II secretion system protein GspL [Rhodocyclales bacterium]